MDSAPNPERDNVTPEALKKQLFDKEQIDVLEKKAKWSCGPGHETEGIFVLTPLRILLIAKNTEVVCVPLRVTRKLKVHEKKSSIKLDFQCKDFRYVFIVIEDPETTDLKSKLVNYCFPQPDTLPAFFLFKSHQFTTPASTEGSDKNQGEAREVPNNIFDIQSEYERFSFDKAPFQISSANSKYDVCDTYPQLLVFPVHNKLDIKECAGGRTRNRVPAIIWRHKNGALLVRCSQPKVGLAHKRNADNEQYMKVLNEIGSSEYPVSILDLRPKMNAQANMVLGGGFESTKHYKNTTREFHALENIHKVRDAWKKMHKLCTHTIYNSNDEKDWDNQLNETQWFHFATVILQAAQRVRDMILKGGTVFVHCSDGWDRTSQVCALAELILDPHYRTLNGFALLIEKEWCSFGHQFALREGHGKNMDDYKEEQRAPIFLQFMDLMHQFLIHFPNAFEFNDSLLVIIVDHLHSCLFGTFLGNCDLERQEVKTKTHTLWALVQANRNKFINKKYDSAAYPAELTGNFDFNFRLWDAYFLRWQDYSYPKFGDCDLKDVLFGLYPGFKGSHSAPTITGNQTAETPKTPKTTPKTKETKEPKKKEIWEKR